MARPIWFRLFGPNGPTNMEELRAALLTAPIGQAGTPGEFVANVRALLNLPPAPVRPGPRDNDQTRDLDKGPHLSTILVAPGQDPVARASDTLAAAATAGHDGEAAIVGREPQAATDAGADQIISLQVGLNPTRGVTTALISYSGGDQSELRSGYTGGWLENYVRFYVQGQQGLPGFEFNNASSEDLASWASASGAADQRIDTVALSGDFSAGFNFSRLPTTINQIVLQQGSDYTLVLDDDFVGAGQTLTVRGDDLGWTGHVIFDGSGETDGKFSFFGSDNDDFFFGGAGNDLVRGFGGADTLSGGDGADTFLSRLAGDSTGMAFDILADFDPAEDKIDLPVTVTGFDSAVTAGTLSVISAADDFAAALGGLGANHAVLFTPDAGDLAGTIFLVVDGNGVAGYQEGEDYVFALPSTTLADLSAHTGFFI